MSLRPTFKIIAVFLRLLIPLLIVGSIHSGFALVKQYSESAPKKISGWKDSISQGECVNLHVSPLH